MRNFLETGQDAVEPNADENFVKEKFQVRRKCFNCQELTHEEVVRRTCALRSLWFREQWWRSSRDSPTTQTRPREEPCRDSHELRGRRRRLQG